MTIQQIKVGFDNFSYLISDPGKKKAALVDPGYDISKADMILRSTSLELQYVIFTHHHRDHTGDCAQLKHLYPSSIFVASAVEGVKLGVKVDRLVRDDDRFSLGNITLKVLATPGHTPDGICILVDDEALITGDTLFIGDCGRTDLPGGDPAQMFQTLQKKILPLPDHLIVYPGHDYGEKPFDTLGNQKQTNKTLRTKNLKEFSMIP